MKLFVDLEDKKWFKYLFEFLFYMSSITSFVFLFYKNYYVLPAIFIFWLLFIIFPYRYLFEKRNIDHAFGDFFNLIDNPIEYMDTIYLTGTSGADGYYSVNQILTDVILSTNENINTSTGGTIYFMHPSGASKIGIDPTGITGVTSNNLQDAIKELSQNATGVTPSQHEILRQLIHFIDNGPAEGFASGAYRETLPSASPFPTSIIWWEDSSKINKIVEKTITYNSNKTPNIIEWKMYDITNSLLATVTDNIVYSGVFELNRTRTIV